MQEKIESFIEEHPEKSPIFLINFPLQVKANNNNLFLQEHLFPVTHKLLDIISTIDQQLKSNLLLLADDKSIAIKTHTQSNISYKDDQLNYLRKQYYNAKKIPDIITSQWLSDSIIPTKTNKPVFSELKLQTQSNKIISNSCAQTYHTLLAEEIDRKTKILISFIPRVCYANLAHYLNSELVDSLYEENNLAVQNIFIDEEGGNEHKIIQL